MLRESPPVVRISISPWLRFTTLGNFSPHSTRTMLPARSAHRDRGNRAGARSGCGTGPGDRASPVPCARSTVRVPSYSWISVKVGLVTSSGSAASSASAMPFTSVVLPAPRSPRRIRNFGGVEQLRNAVPDSDGFLAAVAFELMDFQVRRLRHLGLAAEEGNPSNQTYPASSRERK